MSLSASRFHTRVREEGVLGDLLEEFSARIEAGELLDVEGFAQAHPEHAAHLRQLLPAVQVLAHLGKTPDSGGASFPPGVAAVTPELGTLGDFQLLREVGRGGMGVVYEAEQLSLRRQVALKVLPFAGALDPRQLQRFKNEAQAAASLHHPHIVPVHAVGCERGVHYYAMQFIDGRTLAAVIDDLRSTRVHSSRSGVSPTPLPEGDVAGATIPRGVFSTERFATASTAVRWVAQVGIQTAEALEYAHEHGVIHRDIKPANLLLDARGELWITDFGLAQVQKDIGLTQSGDLLGTLRYMSPEQALGRRELCDQRADVYALGATLYELVTLQPVHTGRDRHALLRQIEWEEPTPLRRHNPSAPADLEIIIHKALAKQPSERYRSAQELADDLRRFLEDKPIQAKRPTMRHRAAKWGRRHQAVVLTVGVAAAILLVVATSALAVGTVLVSREQARTEAANQRLALHLNYQIMASAERERATGNPGRAEALLALCDPALRGWEWHYLRRQRYGNPPPWLHASHLWSLALRADGSLLAVGDNDGGITFWDLRTGTKLRTLDAAHADQVRGLAFSPDGRLLASTSWDRQVLVWEVATGALVHSLPRHRAGTLTVAFSPDGRRLAWGGHDGTARLHDLKTGAEVSLHGHSKGVRRLVFSANGARLISCGDEGAVCLWDVPTRSQGELAPRLTLYGHDHRVFDVALSPDCRRLASAGGQFVMHGDAGVVKIWDAETGAELHALRGHTGAVYAVAFSPDGQRLATGGEDPTVKVWDVKMGVEALTLRGHQEAVWSLAFSPDGGRLYSASGDHTVRTWDATPLEEAGGPERTTLKAHQGRVTSVVFTADGTRLISAGMDRMVRIWDVARGALLETLPNQSGPVHSLALSWDGNRLATGNWSNGEDARGTGAVKTWDAKTWQELPGPLYVHQPGVRGVAFNADGSLLAGAGDHLLMLWHGVTGQLLTTHRARTHFVSVAFSSQGWLAAADENGGLTVWESPLAEQPTRTIAAYPGRAFCVTFRPDGRRLVAAGVDGTIKVWDTATWQVVASLHGQPGGVHTVAYSPDNRLLASGGNDAIVRVWDAEIGREILAFRGHTDTVYGVAFSRDGRLLASASKDGTVKIWNVVVGDWAEKRPPRDR